MAERDREILVQLHLSEHELQVLMRILGSPSLAVTGVQNMRTCVALHDKLRLKASQLMTLKKQASRAGLQSVAKTAANNKAKSAASKSAAAAGGAKAAPPPPEDATPAEKEPAPPAPEPAVPAAPDEPDESPTAERTIEAGAPDADPEAGAPAPATADAAEERAE